ncbi:GEVED domain-containing protein [bacterium]
MKTIETKNILVSPLFILGVVIITLFIHGLTYGQPTANFTANQTTIYVGEAVWFTDLSTNATQWKWKFEGGFPSSANTGGQHYVQYNMVGTYNVTLIIHGATGLADTLTKYLYITVLELELDFGDAPDPTYPTLLANSGASHSVSDDIYLGAGVDSEPDGQPNVNATGDDLNDDDEDGVLIPVLIAGQTVDIDVTAHGTGWLYSWIDFNGDGDWDDASEFCNIIPLTEGSNTLQVLVPDNAVSGKSFARFRFTTRTDISYRGYATDGEVEDYEVTIEAWDFGDVPDPTFPTLLANNGARHRYTLRGGGLFLGNSVDPDPDGQPDAKAYGDDTDENDDDDGVTFVNYEMGYPVIEQGTEQVTIQVTGSSGYLNAWVDFNRDGDWNDPGEQVFQDVVLLIGPSNRVINVPPIADPGFLFARFRLSTSQGLGPDGPAPDGEVEDYALIAHIRDWGDAPEPNYQTLKINNGASHIIRDPTFSLGPTVDAELDGQPNANATGDDLDGNNDDDGVTFSGPIVVGATVDLIVTVTKVCHFYGWIDWDGDGSWTGLETIFTNVVVPPGLNNLNFTVPGSVTPKTTFARFRVGTEFGLGPYGSAKDGEVEDYEVTIYAELDSLDYGDAPDPLYPTLMANGGASHLPDPHVYLGSLFDVEIDGQPNADATGDNQAGSDDEDGIVFITPLIPGNTALINVTKTQGFIYGWMDFDGDGTWFGAGEKIISGFPFSSGSHTIAFNIPMGAATGETFARFRLSSVNPISPIGFGYTGEVEDYKVTIGELVEGAVKWYQPPLKNRESEYPYAFWGWDENSVYSQQIIADDWFCHDDRPVANIHWWGSYAEWDSIVPPPIAPKSFHIGVWTNIEKDVNASFNQPGVMVHEWKVDRDQLNERVVGSDFMTDKMSEPDSCFRYDYTIPQSDWFYQEGDSTVYWLSISAIYNTIPYEHKWGWNTRDRYFKGDAVRMDAPASPALNSTFQTGDPVSVGWDMSFLLTTTEYAEMFDFGDLSDPEYPTMFSSNGAHHIIWPGIYLGEEIDSEDDGLQNALASGDDLDGTDDEDGVEFLTSLHQGQTALIQVTASVEGFLNAWVDFDGNGDLDDPDDQIFMDQPLKSGENLLTFPVPDDAKDADTFSRFRFSPTTGVTFKGLVVGGEVEDYKVSILTIIEEKSENNQKPKEFRLSQNYPNPFNPVTTIRYQLPKPEHVLIKVFDIVGRELDVLVNKHHDAGEYIIHWNASAQASGIYILRIHTGSYVKNIKMVVMR